MAFDGPHALLLPVGICHTCRPLRSLVYHVDVGIAHRCVVLQSLLPRGEPPFPPFESLVMVPRCRGVCSFVTVVLLDVLHAGPLRDLSHHPHARIGRRLLDLRLHLRSRRGGLRNTLLPELIGLLLLGLFSRLFCKFLQQRAVWLLAGRRRRHVGCRGRRKRRQDLERGIGPWAADALAEALAEVHEVGVRVLVVGEVQTPAVVQRRRYGHV
mmetsp:Transcript_91489/g.229939  ORF Transcript_91489/g.229939 Transcript_91489/m.229939 type:complete len:212 (-) Transcript_91489:373-1008(-)